MMETKPNLLDGNSWAIVYWDKWKGLFYRKRAILQLWNGQPNGFAEYRYTNGRPSCRGLYRTGPEGNTVMTGEWRYWDAKGRELGYINFDAQGRRHGPYLQEIPGRNPVIIAKGKYCDGKAVETWLIFHLRAGGCLPIPARGMEQEQWQGTLEIAAGEAQVFATKKYMKKGDYNGKA